jgi:hypothetical protein
MLLKFPASCRHILSETRSVRISLGIVPEMNAVFHPNASRSVWEEWTGLRACTISTVDGVGVVNWY